MQITLCKALISIMHPQNDFLKTVLLIFLMKACLKHMVAFELHVRRSKTNFNDNFTLNTGTYQFIAKIYTFV